MVSRDFLAALPAIAAPNCSRLLQACARSGCPLVEPKLPTVLRAAFFFRAFHNGQRTSQHYVAYSGRSLPCETELRHLGHTPAVRLPPHYSKWGRTVPFGGWKIFPSNIFSALYKAENTFLEVFSI